MAFVSNQTRSVVAPVSPLLVALVNVQQFLIAGVKIRPYNEQWTLGAERQLATNWVLGLVARRDSTSKVVRLLEDLYRRDRSPQLVTVNGEAQRILQVEWSDLVIDADVVNLLKNDFETFWQREPWFREHNLPFRRGYLLHGPPGNGKTSAIRAMATSRSLNAQTLRFFDERADDSDLDDLFATAHRDRPSIILLEDIDRAFPRTGESRSKVSLQHLLNCLDGVATGCRCSMSTTKTRKPSPLVDNA